MKAGVPGRRVQLLPERSRRRRRDRAAVRPQHVLRRRRRRRLVCRRSAHRAARPGLQQGPVRRRTRAGRWRDSSRSDRGVDRRERRPVVRQRLRRVDAGARPRDRRGAGRAARGDRAAGGRRSARPRSRRSSIRASRDASRDQIDAGLQEPGAEDVTARYRAGPAARRARRQHVSAADGRPLHVVVASARQSRVPVSVRVGRRRHAPTRWRRCPRASGRRWSSRRSRSDQALIDRLLAIGSHRPAEPRADPDEHDRLGSAARGQSVRASVRPPGVSDARCRPHVPGCHWPPHFTRCDCCI